MLCPKNENFFLLEFDVVGALLRVGPEEVRTSVPKKLNLEPELEVEETDGGGGTTAVLYL